MLEATHIDTYRQPSWGGPRSGILVLQAEEPGRALIPADLDNIEPGPVLGVILAAIDLDQLSSYDLVTVMRAHNRMAAHFEAQTLRAISSVAAHYQEMGKGWESEMRCNDAAASEVSAALHLTRRAAEHQLALALDLRDRLPQVGRLLSTGAIDIRRARVLVEGTVHLSEELARRVVHEVAHLAPRMTTGQLRRAVRKLSMSLEPDDAVKRYDTALAERRISSVPTNSGTSHLFAFDLPPDLVAQATRRINHIAKSLRRTDDGRTIDQIRADVFLDLLNGASHETVGRGVVDIRVDLTTLAELDDHTGELAGYGPVIADIARKTVREANKAEFRYVVTDADGRVSLGTTRARPTPRSGTADVAEVSDTEPADRRLPSAKQRRIVEMLRPLCAFPGCLMPATQCDIDHIDPWANLGPTRVRNLAPLCRHDHVGKDAGWAYEILADGSYRWTSPLGHIYDTPIDEPPMRTSDTPPRAPDP